MRAIRDPGTMTSLDVARYILERKGSMTAMKLQKLVYYAQAWSTVWDERTLFRSKIEAWANGPVVHQLYSHHRGKFKVSVADIPGDLRKVDAKARETIDAVLKYYGEKPAYWLSQLTHQEAPWRDARQGVPAGVRSSVEIKPAALQEYYSSLV